MKVAGCLALLLCVSSAAICNQCMDMTFADQFMQDAMESYGTTSSMSSCSNPDTVTCYLDCVSIELDITTTIAGAGEYDVAYVLQTCQLEPACDELEAVLPAMAGMNMQINNCTIRVTAPQPDTTAGPADTTPAESTSPSIIEIDNDHCGAEYRVTEEAGQITSPDYPSDYPASVDSCITVLQADLGSTIQLNFEDFYIESHSSCNYDYVEVRDGDNSAAPLLGKFCGSETPRRISSSGRYMWIKFHSDSSVSYEGFMATYSSQPMHMPTTEAQEDPTEAEEYPEDITSEAAVVIYPTDRYHHYTAAAATATTTAVVVITAILAVLQ